MRSPCSHRSLRHSSGSTFVIALLMLMVISIAGASVLLTVSTRYNYTQKAIGWDEALAAAEAGADYGLLNCRRTLSTSAANPWIGWKKYTGAYTWTPVANSADANVELAAYPQKLIYDVPPDAHLMSTGEGATEFWYHVEVDAPSPQLVVNGSQWYRIRSTGYAALPGFARAGNDNPSGARTHNDILRKMDLRFDHFIMRYGDYAHAAGSAVPVSPQATRRVEVIAKPVTSFSLAAFAASPSGSPLKLSLIDSFDSRDTVNYPTGLYNNTARNASTGVGSKGSIYVNAPISSLSATVYGDVFTNFGSVAKNSNISGDVDDQDTRDLPTVSAPSWAASVVSSPASTLVAGTPTSPVYCSWSSINSLSVTLPPGYTTGVANIYVSGNVTGGITIAKGVTLKIWFTGNLTMEASSITNQNNNAAYLQLYGINPPAGQSRTVTINSDIFTDIFLGGPGFRYFLLDSPGHDVTVTSNPDICGAIVARSINATGSANLHYDEALGSMGDIVDFKRAMWVEDER